MKSPSLAELKKELKSKSHSEILEICIRLSRHKKENKELLTYLIHHSEDEQSYLHDIKNEMDELFSEINYSNAYLAKKGLRKVLRIISRYTNYSDIAETEIETLLYFCKKVNESKIKGFMKTNPVLMNLYQNQLKKIQKSIGTLHEDLQYDYQKELSKL